MNVTDIVLTAKMFFIIFKQEARLLVAEQFTDSRSVFMIRRHIIFMDMYKAWDFDIIAYIKQGSLD